MRSAEPEGTVDRPERAWVAVCAAAFVAFALGASLVRTPWYVGLAAIAAAPCIAFGVTKLAGPRAAIVFGTALGGAAGGLAILAVPILTAKVGTDLRRASGFYDPSLLASGAATGALVYACGFAGGLLARDRGPAVDRAARAIAGLVGGICLVCAVMGAVVSAARPDRTTWLDALEQESFPTGAEGDRLFVDLPGERVFLGPRCGTHPRTPPDAAVPPQRPWGTAIWVARDPVRDVRVVLCDPPTDIFRVSLIAAYRRGPSTPPALDPSTDPAGMRFAVPRAWLDRGAAGLAVALVWLAVAALLRSRRLRALAMTATGEHQGGGRVQLEDGRTVTIESAAVFPPGPLVLSRLVTSPGPAYREPAWPGAKAEVVPGPREPLVRACEGRFTAACVSAAALLLVVGVPIAVAW